MKQRILILAICFVGIGLFVASFFGDRGQSELELEEGEVLVSIGKHEFVAEVVDTPESRARGLSGREMLGEGRGMLFLFDPSASSGQVEPEVQSFWMKEMKFPIDIIWIREGRVIGAERNVPPPLPGTPLSKLPLYISLEPVDAVFETQAGMVEKLGIQPGDKFIFPSNVSDTIVSWSTSQ